MKIKKYLLALLISGATLMGVGSLSAQEESAVDEAAVAAATELALAPAKAALAAGNDQAEAYLGLLEAQGDYAYAFDFFTVSMLWTVIAAALVFVMHLGFATLEAGLTQSKNTVNIMFKNVFIISIGIISYAVIGFNTHYPGDFNGWISFGSWIGDLSGPGMDDFSYGGVGLAMTAYGDFIFQAMFAATAATIVSGAVAERIKLGSFMIFATLLVAIAYPVVGSWHWGEGWLNRMENPFYDFAGSSVVHAFGGFAALACVMILGPRAGKYVDGKIKPILGHSMPLATIGVFLLFLGWFGFNGGSVLSANPAGVGLVFTTTALAASAGALASIAISWIFLKKPDLSMALNGILAGLVGITAGADSMGPGAAIIVGAVAGVIVVFSIIFFDKIKIDDPVGAISVHGVCGVWGTLAVAFFGGANFVSQLVGTVSVSLAAFIFAAIVFFILKVTIGVRVSPEEEAEGLDIGEHGAEAYPDFANSSR